MNHNSLGKGSRRYYVPAAVRALLHPGAVEDDLALSFFANAIESYLRSRPKELRPVAKELAVACAEILAFYGNSFPEEDAPFGDLRSRYLALQKTLEEMLPRPTENIRF